MSTLSPSPPTPKGPRSTRRNPKKSTVPSAQNGALLTTPPSSPPRNVSPGGTATDSSNNANLSRKKNSRSNKKPRDIAKASPAQISGHRQTSSHPNSITTPQMNSPHYAGPTFHASPAPSALPMPSFFSKSIPHSDTVPTVEPENDTFDVVETDLEVTPSKPKSRPLCADESPKSTPLDFLFKAAVEARSSRPHRSPEPYVQSRSPQTDLKALQQRKHSGAPCGSLPRKVEDSDTHNPHIGPSFAASYRDRMNALRVSVSPRSTDSDEKERRLKTEALKDLLLNPRPQRPSSASTISHTQRGNLNEGPSARSTVPHFATPLRTSSGPAPAVSPGSHVEQQQMTGSYSPLSRLHSSSPQSQNTAIRKEVLSSIPTNSTYASPDVRYEQSKYQNEFIQNSLHLPAHNQSPASRAISGSSPSQNIDTKKMEDDLRRILKLDVNPGFPSNNMQSSYA